MAAAIPLLIAASVATQVYTTKRTHDHQKRQRREAEAAAEKARIKAEAAENVKAQGQEQTQAADFSVDNPFESTGGVPMSIKQRLRISDTGASV